MSETGVAISRRAARLAAGVMLACTLAAVGGGPVSSHTTSGTRASSTTAAPDVLYTDIASGPTSGGERNDGTYLSLFGRNFGDTGLGSRVKVLINGAEVASYRYLGPAKVPGIEEITVQVGAIGHPKRGVRLPIKVIVNGVASNTDHTFIVQPGRIFFVDPTAGNDATAAPGDISKPYRTVQGSDGGEGSCATRAAWSHVRAGDTIVLRAGTYRDTGIEGYFARFETCAPWRGSGTRPTGVAGHGPITVIGYPGERPFVDGTAAIDPAGALSGLNGQNYPHAGKWIVIADLHIEGGGYDGPISQEIYGNNWRIVNNELTAYTGVTSGPTPSKMGGITGNGADAAWLGNDIHDIHGSFGEAHGIYIDGDGSYYIAYNWIHNIYSGNGFQTYSNGANGSDSINNVNFNHNLLSNVSKHLINIGDGSAGNFQIWDNVASGARYAGIRFNTNTLHHAKIYNNTFYDVNRARNPLYGAITNDWSLPRDALDVRNNIFDLLPSDGRSYSSGTVGIDGPVGTIANNLWYGGRAAPPFATNSVVGDPLFVNATAGDFHLRAASRAIGRGSAAVAPIVTGDFDGHARPPGAAYDIGAYQFGWVR